jgi:Tfp pilus assembly protein PilX
MRILSSRRQRGSALLFVIVLLAVLSLVGGASVLLSSRERQNAGAKTSVSTSIACANAAQARLWVELSKYGMKDLAKALTLTEVRLPDGTELAVPAHYRDLGTGGMTAVILADEEGAAPGGGQMRDIVNVDADASQLGRTTTLTARCTTPSGREMEVEFGIRFML